ncbi:MAG: hypothetical protein IKW64_03065 [Clostridia bacterium]|nr:hypothetical protein [Clostridia bacterium]
MKTLRLTLVTLMLIFALTGCNGNNTQTPQVQESENALQNEAVVQQQVVRAQTLPAGIAGFTEVTSYTGDVDADGIDERVVLSTEAEREPNGEFLWNDGQDWALYVEDTNGVYVLLDQYIQAGNAYFEVSDYYMKDGAEPKISVMITTGAGFSLKTYGFSKTENGYAEETVYDTGSVTESGINRRFSSFPEIIK